MYRLSGGPRTLDRLDQHGSMLSKILAQVAIGDLEELAFRSSSRSNTSVLSS